MDIVFMVVGAITCLAISTALFSLAFYIFSEWNQEREQKKFWVAKEKAAKEIGQKIQGVSYWFSESVEAYKVLDLVGAALAKEGQFNESRVRDAWRDEIKIA